MGVLAEVVFLPLPACTRGNIQDSMLGLDFGQWDDHRKNGASKQENHYLAPSFYHFFFLFC